MVDVGSLLMQPKPQHRVGPRTIVNLELAPIRGLPPLPVMTWAPPMRTVPSFPQPTPVRAAVQSSFLAPNGSRLNFGFNLEGPAEQGAAFGAGVLVGAGAVVIGLGVLYLALRPESPTSP